ncbi:hypothetical protein AB0I81_13330 [Nonomuraea sp. NPDC050404]|uniref:hypothetical protein n=1 Tax=Nonomuraea sp. NPDC050404 TaxID=3155783 RepID=UPI00340533AB
MRSFGTASTWLAAYVMGIPTALLFVLAAILAVQGTPFLMFTLPYLVLFTLAYLVGLVLLALLPFRPAWLRALVTAVAVYALASVAPFVGVMVRYPVQVVKCGGLPIVATGFAAAMSYHAPGDENYSVSPLDTTFFCTAKEAEAADFHNYDN